MALVKFVNSLSDFYVFKKDKSQDRGDVVNGMPVHCSAAFSIRNFSLFSNYPLRIMMNLEMKKNQKPSSFWSEFVPKSWLFLNGNYSWNFFKHDLIAGITVGIVALPLAMAFAIAAGLTPQAGLYTAIIAGFLISLLGGSRFQIGGPTGAFVVIIYDIVQKRGYEGLVAVTLIAGVILLIAALSRLGGLIKYVPYPLISGFTTGIAVIIFFFAG